MPGQCTPDDIQKVKAILEAVNELNQGGNRSELIETIKRCASKTGLSADVLTSSLGKISGITPHDISVIVAAIPTPVEFKKNDRVKINKESRPRYHNKEGIIKEILDDNDVNILLDDTNEELTVKIKILEKIPTSGGGKRKSKKNKSKKNKSKKSKSKKHSKKRKHRKMRRTRR